MDEAMMPPQVVIKKWKVSKRSITHVERKTPLHGKMVTNHNMIVLKRIATYVLLERNSTNGNDN